MYYRDKESVRIHFEFDSWVSRAGLACGTLEYRNLAKTYYLTATVVTLLLIITTTDFIGRKKGFYIAFVVTNIGMLLTLFLPTFMLQMIALGIATAVGPIYLSLYMIFFAETMRILLFKKRLNIRRERA